MPVATWLWSPIERRHRAREGTGRQPGERSFTRRTLLPHLWELVGVEIGSQPPCEKSAPQKGGSSSSCCGDAGGGCQSGGRCSGSRGSLTQVHQGLVLGWWPLNRISQCAAHVVAPLAQFDLPFAGLVHPPDFGVDRPSLCAAWRGHELCAGRSGVIGCAEVVRGPDTLGAASAETTRTRRGWCDTPARSVRSTRWFRQRVAGHASRLGPS